MISGKRIIVFGTGDYYKKNEKEISLMSPILFFDNDKKKNGLMLHGVKVVQPDFVATEDADYIILMSSYENEMMSQLIGLGVDKSKIVTYDEFRRYSFSIKQRFDIKEQYSEYNSLSDSAEARDHRVLIVTPTMTFNGASIAALHLARILKKNHFKVIVLAPSTGKITAHFLYSDIPVLFDEHLEAHNSELLLFMESFDYVLLNSLTVQNLVYGVPDTHTKFIWWLHESDYGFDCAKKDLSNYFSENLQIYCVGERVKNAVLNKWGYNNVGLFLYGVQDRYKNTIDGSADKKHGKTVFACVGYISKVKAQDIFVKCLDYLDESVRSDIELWIVGRILDEELFGIISAYIEKYDCIKYLGEYSPEQVQSMYRAVDYVVCPSRRDSMPTVTVEAMMNYRIPIVSNVVGTASYIENGVSGYVFESENINDLANVITEAYYNRVNYDAISEKGRMIYERYFSMDKFEVNILEIFK